MNNHFIKGIKKSSGRKKAQGMVEFALILPILLVLILGVIEFSRLMFAWIIIENSTRFGIRYATTGNYNEAYCPSLDCTTDEEVDAARIPSIEDETRNIIIGFFTMEEKDYPSVTNADEQYLNITVCSAEDGRVFIPPRMGQPFYAACNLNGTSSEHPGSPGNRVVVAADYNFSFMVIDALGLFNNPNSPFGAQPGMIHLASYREGIVEQFRATRAINTPLPLNVATVPTNTPIPTETFTPSPTYTPSPTRTPSRTPTITQTPTKTLTPTITYTPSPTRTATTTPVPSCSNIFINRTRFNGDNFEARVLNNNVAPAFLTNASLVWNTAYAPTMFFNYASFNGNQYYDTNSTTSPVNAPASPSIQMDGSGTQATWLADFDSSTFEGSYTVTLTFNFPGWGNCVLTGNVSNFPPPPTLTFTPSRTPTRTLTPTITRTPTRTLRQPSQTRPPSHARRPGHRRHRAHPRRQIRRFHPRSH